MGEQAWVEDFDVRLREDGHVFVGNVMVVPGDERQITRRCAELASELQKLDWQVHDVVVAPVTDLRRDERSEGG